MFHIAATSERGCVKAAASVQGTVCKGGLCGCSPHVIASFSAFVHSRYLIHLSTNHDCLKNCFSKGNTVY